MLIGRERYALDGVCIRFRRNILHPAASGTPAGCSNSYIYVYVYLYNGDKMPTMQRHDIYLTEEQGDYFKALGTATEQGKSAEIRFILQRHINKMKEVKS